MSLLAEKLHYRKGGVTYDVDLYDDTADLGGAEYVSFRVNGATVYAVVGDIGDSKATDLRVRKGGTTLAFWEEATIDLPSGLIAMFDASCSSGWTRVSAFDDNFLQGASVYGGTGTGVHTHDVTVSAGTTGSTTPSKKDGQKIPNMVVLQDDVSGSTTHSHAFSSATDASGNGTNLPAYINIVFCKKD